jgi:hypothetical protein
MPLRLINGLPKRRATELDSATHRQSARVNYPRQQKNTSINKSVSDAG